MLSIQQKLSNYNKVKEQSLQQAYMDVYAK